MTLTAYTDASYRERIDISACGFMVYIDGILVKNSVVIISGLEKVINAEVYAIKEALKHCFLTDGVTKIDIYTDQLAICLWIRDGLGRKPMYKELYEIIEIIEEHGIAVRFNKVKSHRFNEKHNQVDANCSKCLIEYLKSQPELFGKELHYSRIIKVA